MSIDYQTLKNWQFPVLQHAYDADDTMRYALAVGLGAAATSDDIAAVLVRSDPAHASAPDASGRVLARGAASS